ncbi:tubulin polyglutamylase TTLL5 isoform X3 [Oryzias latipes]
MPAVVKEKGDSESSSEDEKEDHQCISWSGLSKTIPVLLFLPEAAVSKDRSICSVGERYNMAFKIVRTESRLVRGILTNHGFHEVHPNSNDFNLMWTGSHLKPYILRSLQDFQKVNHFPRSYELTRKDRLYKNIQRMQQTHGFKHFHIIPQTFVLPSEYQEFRSCFAKDKGPWIIKPVASSRGRGIYLVSNPNQISMDDNILVSRYINNPLLIDDFKFDMRLYVLVTSYDPLLIYVYEEGLARFATVKYDQTSTNIKNTFMHLTNYSLNKKSSDYVSCDDPEVEDYGNKWSMSAVLRYLKQEGKDTTLLMSQIEDLIIKAVLSAEHQISTACKTFVPHKTNCFELYGFDVLIDSNLKPWLLEVNLSPSLSCDAPLDLKIKASMIADMFSLVGFVCQDPLPKQARSDRVMSEKPPAAQRAQRQKQTSTTNPETDTQGPKHSRGDSTLSLTSEEIKVLRRIKEEHERRGGFIRIFPTVETWELYSVYLESKPSMNFMLANRLFHGRNVNENVQLQVDTVHDCHVVQYERKLLSLEARKKRQRHLTYSSAGRKKTWENKSKASLTENSSPGVEECAPQEREEVKEPFEPISHKQRKQVASPLEPCHSIPLSSSDAAIHNARPKINLLHILEQSWDLSKVQARIAFSAYLQRVQQRLLTESRASSIPVWPDRDNDQMELVIRFLKRAARNLQQDIKVVSPDPQLPLRDCKRLLSHQLGEFILCYNKETEHMVRKQGNSEEKGCVNYSIFEEYITTASESSLEEVLTFYTQKNKAASVFLGTKDKSVKKDTHGINFPGDSNNCENFGSLPTAKEDSNASQSSLCAGKLNCDPNIKAGEKQSSVSGISADQQLEATREKTQPAVQSSHHSSDFPLNLDSDHICFQNYSSATASAPLYCPPPPAPRQPPSYMQSLAKSQLCQSEAFPAPPGYPSPTVIPQPPRVAWAYPSTDSTAAKVATPALRRIHSFTMSASRFGAAASIPGATHIYNQKLSRPTSAGQAVTGSISNNLKSNSVTTFRELHSLSAQAQANQQSFISALQKLAEKQVARRCASSSHINLLTQHLTRLNLSNGMLNSATSVRPMKDITSGKNLQGSTSFRPPKEDVWGEQVQTVSDMDLKQHHHPAKTGYPHQFAVPQLQQQSLTSQQFPDQDRFRHQVPTKSSSYSPPTFHSQPNPSHGRNHHHTCVSPTIAPKPPSVAREGQTRKTVSKRLINSALSPHLLWSVRAALGHTVGVEPLIISDVYTRTPALCERCEIFSFWASMSSAHTTGSELLLTCSVSGWCPSGEVTD